MYDRIQQKIEVSVFSYSSFYPNLATFPFSKMSVETKDGKTISLEGNQLKSALQYLPTQVSTFYSNKDFLM